MSSVKIQLIPIRSEPGFRYCRRYGTSEGQLVSARTKAVQQAFRSGLNDAKHLLEMVKNMLCFLRINLKTYKKKKEQIFTCQNTTVNDKKRQHSPGGESTKHLAD